MEINSNIIIVGDYNTPLTLKHRSSREKINKDNSVQFSHSVMSNSLQPHGLQHARPCCPSLTPGACSNLYPLSRWCHPTISSSVIPFSSHLQSFPGSRSFPMSHFFTSGGQNIEVSASASVLPTNILDWFPLGLTGLISLQPKGLSRVFTNATVQKHQFDALKSINSNEYQQMLNGTLDQINLVDTYRTFHSL